MNENEYRKIATGATYSFIICLTALIVFGVVSYNFSKKSYSHTASSNSSTPDTNHIVIDSATRATYNNQMKEQIAKAKSKEDKLIQDYNSGIISGVFYAERNNCNCCNLLKVRVQGNMLYFDKLENQNTQRVYETEAYVRSTERLYEFHLRDYPSVLVTIQSPSSFYFTNPGVRNCNYTRYSD